VELYSEVAIFEPAQQMDHCDISNTVRSRFATVRLGRFTFTTLAESDRDLPTRGASL
jgi:hypothetical protein